MPGEGCIMPGSAADSLARDARKFVFDYFVEQAVPPVLDQIMERYRLPPEEGLSVLKGREDAILTIEESHALSVPIYRDKLRVEYVRPGKDQLVAHFRSLGLTGDFWRL